MEQEIIKKERDRRENALLKLKEVLARGIKRKAKRIVFDDEPDNYGYKYLPPLAEEAVKRYLSEQYGKICGWANSKTDKPYMKVSSKLLKDYKEGNYRTAIVEIFPENLKNILKSQLEYIKAINEGEKISEEITDEFPVNSYETYKENGNVAMAAVIFKRFNDTFAPVKEMKINDNISAAGMWWSVISEVSKLDGETLIRTQLIDKDTGETVTPCIYEHFVDSTIIKVDYPVIKDIRFVSLDDAVRAFVEEQVGKITGTAISSAKLLSDIYGKENEDITAERCKNKLKALEGLIPEMQEGRYAYRAEIGRFSFGEEFKPEQIVVCVGNNRDDVMKNVLKELFQSIVAKERARYFQREITVKMYCFVKQENADVIYYEPVYSRYLVDGEGNYSYLGRLPITKYKLRIKVDSDDGTLSKTKNLRGNDLIELHKKKFSAIFDMMDGLTGTIKVNTAAYERQGVYYMSPLPVGSVERYNVLKNRIVGECNGKDEIFFTSDK